MQGYILFLALLVVSSKAFSPVLQASRVVVPSHASVTSREILLQMSEEPSDSDPAQKQVSVSSDGTYYDDEVEPAPKVGISDSMRERLRREASSGLDPEAKQTNVILYIIGAVGVLVVLGGAGVFY